MENHCRQLNLIGLSKLCGGYWINAPKNTECAVSVCTDTRAIVPGALFLALKGEHFDAHDFLADAVAKGAKAVCVDNPSKISSLDCPALVVDDTLRAYQMIAGAYRRSFEDLTLVAVTGSVGKTSVKEMLRAIFVAHAGIDAVLCTEGNTNNQIGVPQNLLRLSDGCKYAVIEIGTSSSGEVEPLSACAMPQISIVNSIAPCHLEQLESLEGIAREKAKIYSGLTPAGVAIKPFECTGADILETEAEHADAKILSFGEEEGADVRVEYQGGTLYESMFELFFPNGKSVEVNLPLAGVHQALNAASAAAAAFAAGVAPEVIAEGLTHTILPGMRMKISEYAGVTFLNDAYNANPASVKAALRQLAENGAGENLVLVLGDMLELGKCERKEHRKILKLAYELMPEVRILAVGSRMKIALDDLELTKCVWSADSTLAHDELLKLIHHGDLVFLKGSRGVKLELALPESAR